MKKRLLPLLLALLLLALTGCEDLDSTDPLDELSQFYRQENEEPEPEPLTAFTLPYVSGETLDPLTTTDTVQQTVGQLLYEGLFALNEQFEPEPVLADAYTYDSESRTWTITLRSGVMFSDGSMLTAQDVAASLARAKSSPRYGARLRCVNSVTAWDGAVVITLSEDVATLPFGCAHRQVRHGDQHRPHRHRPVPVRQGRYRRVPHRQHLLVAGSVPAGAAHRAAPLQGQGLSPLRLLLPRDTAPGP